LCIFATDKTFNSYWTSNENITFGDEYVAEVGGRFGKSPFVFIMQTQEEIWKDVVGYEGLYQVSNLGRVRSFGFDKWHKGKIIKGCFDGKKKYLFVSLHKEGKSKGFNIHRLVATAFIPNPNNLPQVNHKDENKENNCVENLEWCTSIYNTTYNNVAYKKADVLRKKVSQYLPDGTWIATYSSEMEAARQTGFAASHISAVCRGQQSFAYGYIWKFNE
jgi:hypothetical protein